MSKKIFTKITYGKFIAVIFLTCLIWIWADLALDENFTVNNLVINVAKSTPENLLVTLNGQTELTLDEVVLRGSASKVTEVKRKIDEGILKPEVFFNISRYSWKQVDTYTLNVLSFLKESDFINQLGVTVVDCQPETIKVQVHSLVKKELQVKCFDNSLNEIGKAKLDPSTVQMYVPEYWSGEQLSAKIVLSKYEQQQARVSPIYKKPFIEITIADNLVKRSQQEVKVRLPAQQSLLAEQLITSPRLGIILSPNLQGKYKVEILNLNSVLSPISVNTTEQAKRAYENMPYHVILQIYDSDLEENTPDKTFRRSLIYNFPPEFLRNEQIELNQQPETARFNITPLEGSAAQSAGD